MRTIRLLLLPAAAVIALAAPGVASAETFCVHQPAGCMGPTSATLADALAQAASNGVGTKDTIRVGAGTFQDTPAIDVAGNVVDIVGEGPKVTVLRAVGTSVKVLQLLEPSSLVSQLRIQVTGTGLEQGLVLAGVADHIEVTTSGTQVAVDGVECVGNAATLQNSLVSLSYGPNEIARAVAVGSGSATVSGSYLLGEQGVDAPGGAVEVRNSRIWAQRAIGVEFGGYGLIEDSSVRVPGAYPSSKNPTALAAGGDGDSVLDVQRVTAYGDNSPNTTGVYAGPQDVAGNHAVVDLEGSVLYGFERDAWIWGGLNAQATLNSTWSAYRFGSAGASTGGQHNSADDIDLTGVDPGFVDFAGGVLALRNDSPLIDAGEPTYQLSAALDRDGNARLRDGDGANGARVDVGALEYQRVAPKVSASATPSALDPGQAATFNASASDADPGDALTYVWSFDDGASASGASVQHAFTAAGAHTGTVTVSDSSGLSTSVQATVAVVAPPAPAAPVADPVPPTPAAPGATVAPKVTGLRLSRTVFRARGARSAATSRRVRVGTIARFAVSQPALVALTIERRVHGRWVELGVARRLRVSGAGEVALDGRLHRRPLPRGRYRIVAVARAAGGLRSAPVAVRFRIV